MTRDVAPKLGKKKPALVHSKFLPALQVNKYFFIIKVHTETCDVARGVWCLVIEQLLFSKEGNGFC